MALKRAGRSDITELVTLIKNRFGKVENKSGVDIRSEMSRQEVVNALGYTPQEYKETQTASIKINEEKTTLVITYGD